MAFDDARLVETRRLGEAEDIVAESAKLWLNENTQAIESSNAYVEQHGLPFE